MGQRGVRAEGRRCGDARGGLGRAACPANGRERERERKRDIDRETETEITERETERGGSKRGGERGWRLQSVSLCIRSNAGLKGEGEFTEKKIAAGSRRKRRRWRKKSEPGEARGTDRQIDWKIERGPSGEELDEERAARGLMK